MNIFSNITDCRSYYYGNILFNKERLWSKKINYKAHKDKKKSSKE